MADEHIEIRSGRGGESAYIARTRVRVSDIARLYRLSGRGSSEERILKPLPHLTRRQVQVALDYWRSHEAEIDAEIAEERAILKRLPGQP